MKPLEIKLPPVVVEGVIQIAIPIEPNDIQFLQPRIQEHLSLPDSEIRHRYVSYCSSVLWRHPAIVERKRYPSPLVPGMPTDVLDAERMLDTATKLKVIPRDEASTILEEWHAKKRDPEELLRNSYALDAAFWPIHYVDYHLAFLDAAVHFGFTKSEVAGEISRALLGLNVDNLQFDHVAGRVSDGLGGGDHYQRVKREIESVYSRVAGHFLHVYTQDTLQASLLALSDSDKYLAPGFINKSLGSIKFISFSELKALHQPEIVVEGLLAISSYAGQLGQGNILKTHSLFPGEKAVVTVETYRKESSSFTLTSSVLDATSAEAERSLSDEVNFGSTYNNESTRNSSFSFGAEAKANWGWGSGGANASTSQSSSSTSRSTVSNATKALRSQAQKVSNNRSVKIDTTTTGSVESTNRHSIVRTIENINVSRPLNFIFRQMTQRILSLISVVDARVCLREGILGNGTVCLLEQFPDIARSKLFVPGQNQDALLRKYYNWAVDAANGLAYRDLDPQGRSFVVDAPDLVDPIPRKRVNEELKATIRLPGSAGRIDKSRRAALKALEEETREIEYSGILLELCDNSMKTEGVYVECFLSDNEGLDDYSKGLQEEAVAAKRLANDLTRSIAADIVSARSQVAAGQTLQDKLEASEKMLQPLYRQVFCARGKDIE